MLKKILICLALVFPLLSGCGKDAGKSTTQVAAKVNDEEISVHQLNAVLTNAQSVPPEALPGMRREVLERLIEQQLVFEQATDKKLDRSPEVMMALEASKRDIVAQAYIKQIVAALPKPADADVTKYYAEHPALFSRRRVYSLQEISFAPRPEITEEAKRMAASGRSIEDIAGWLKSKGVQFRVSGGVRPAEDVSMEILPGLAELKDGQIGVFSGERSTTVVRVIASQSAPVDEATARERIQAYLHNAAAQRAVKEEVARLKAAATIVRQGEFAPTESPAAAKPAVPTAPAMATPAAVSPVAPSAIEKGAAGLK